MKVFAVFLSLLGLSLLQEALCTHQTCECHENRMKMQQFDSTQCQALENIERRLTSTMEQFLQPIQDQLNYHLPPAPTSSDPRGTSCKDIKEKNPDLSSGYYWIGESGSAVRVYCSMEETCGSETGGWMRVANIDMRNTSHTCPSGLTLLTTSSSQRLCNIPHGVENTCISSTFSAAGVQYSRVCGKIIGYQYRGLYAFYYHNHGIDGNYVHGVSLTHGQSPRKHIWTFAGALDESTSVLYRWKCPCINPRATVPSYVENDYFCDTAVSGHSSDFGNNRLETADPLWDGQGCTTSSCCSFNTPPWFVRDLPSPTTDDIEMRVCLATNYGTTPIEIVELYVQ